ncbi:MAG: lipoate--protein ligase family protein [Planctomycetes bacterium]|nr:lipoate--protein ligase family protein [Planctomycetota bacterium]
MNDSVKNPGGSWRLVVDSPQDAATNMAVDEAILRTTAHTGVAADTVPSLRIYRWKPGSVSIGYSQQMSDVLGGLEPGVPPDDASIVRRPTGGATVVHDAGPSFSLVMPKKSGVYQLHNGVTDLYAFAGRCVAEALSRQGLSVTLWGGSKRTVNNSRLCASSLCPYDAVYKGRKIAGYAARRMRGATLLQGYVTLGDGSIRIHADDLIDAMAVAVGCVAGVKLSNHILTEEEQELSARLRAGKYALKEWNYKRKAAI